MESMGGGGIAVGGGGAMKHMGGGGGFVSRGKMQTGLYFATFQSSLIPLI